MTWGIAPIALAVGTLMGVLGGGGGIVLVPILLYLVGMDKDNAISTSLIVVALGAVAGLHSHARNGHTRWREGTIFGLMGGIGSIIGSKGSRMVPEPIALTLFGLLLVVVIAMMIRKLRAPLTDDIAARRPWPIIFAAATLVGFLTGFFGVGGGFIIVPLLMLVMAFPIKAAVGTSLLVMALNGAVGVAYRILTGMFDAPWLIVGSFTALVMLGSWLGGRLGQYLPSRPLNIAFICLLACVSVTMLSLNVPKLLH